MSLFGANLWHVRCCLLNLPVLLLLWRRVTLVSALVGVLCALMAILEFSLALAKKMKI